MVKILWSRPRRDAEGEIVGYDNVDAATDGVLPGDLLYVTVGSDAIRGHMIRPATDLANALGCDVGVVTDPDLGRAPAAQAIAATSSVEDADAGN